MTMKLFALLLTTAFVVSTVVTTGAADAPGVGDPAPAFSLIGSDGETYSLDDFKGTQAFILAWLILWVNA